MSRPRALDRAERERGAAAFAAHLAAVRPEIEKRLAATWKAKLAVAERHGADVRAIADAARDLTMRGGKRFRAALLAAAYAGVAPRAALAVALDAGVALELLQSYLLMQDDWMDGDSTRRGGPSAHASLGRTLGDAHLGNAAAILASDLTWGMALGLLSSLRAPPARRLEVVRVFLDVHEDVVFGQQLDLMGAAENVEAMHALKTGSYTLRGPLVLGATLAGASKGVVRALTRYAEPLGVAFQLRDDLLGTFGSAAETGKPVAGDLREGKRTALLAEAEGRLDASGRRALAKVFGRRDAAVGPLRDAAQAIEACGARAAVESRLDALCDRGELLAAELPLSPRCRAILIGAASALRPPALGGTAAAARSGSARRVGAALGIPARRGTTSSSAPVGRRSRTPAPAPTGAFRRRTSR